LLVQQALHEHERITCDKAFRGYLSLTWGLLEKPHDVPNPYYKNPQPSAWVISTLSNLGNFSGKTAARNSMIPIAEIAHCYANPQDILAADRQLLNRPISKVLNFKRSTKATFLHGIRRAHRRFLSERLERQYTIRHFFDPSVPNPAPIDPHLRVP
jgi:hypothetical protein